MSSRRRKTVLRILLSFAILIAVLMGVGLGLALAATHNSGAFLRMSRGDPALPTRILDVNDREITEFFRDEKRTLISINDVPRHLIDALVTREDQHFFSHHGFQVRSMLRAAWNNLTGRYFSGSSTITQQLAGTLYADRTEISIRRKLVELWWAIQLERQYTKNEILEMYMNTMPFGGGTNGVEAASQYYFRHGVKDITLAESAMLVIQLAHRPGYYSPIRYPERAGAMQKLILDQMVQLGYCSREEADVSYAGYWATYDYTRSGTLTPYLMRASLDKARYFSEYIRNYLEDTLVGSMNIYKDGLTVHTTLNLDYQSEADTLMKKGIDDINARYLANAGKAANEYAGFLPLLDMFGLAFNIVGLSSREQDIGKKMSNRYVTDINPVVDLVSAVFGLGGAQGVAAAGYDAAQAVVKKTQVQGALICLDSKTGYILAMVGGRELKSTDEYNRAVNGYVQPGSTFKPLYYSAAIDSRMFTAATMILDEPVVFTSPDGTLYMPQNFKGQFHGRVLLRNALADSMNIPSLKVLDGIGFDAAIQRASRMLGITDSAKIVSTFPRYYPLGLGIVSVSPLQMAQAYAVFANQGREVEPIAVRYIEDRNGKIILEPEKEVRAAQARKGSSLQIMSPQTAYIMTSILQTTLRDGTLQGNFTIEDLEERPMAGKTGTTDNWEDIWTVGFSPQITTAVWFGFDEGSRSLGREITGATAAGPLWARFMRAVHKNLPTEGFMRPETGLVEVTVSASSGLLPTPYSKKVFTEIFLAGTEPKVFDEIDQYEAERGEQIRSGIINTLVPGELPGTDSGMAIPPLEGPAADGEPAPSGNPLLD